MGQGRCTGDHEYETRRLGVGLARLRCRKCGGVVIDLDAAKDGPAVTEPGLFGPAKPTIFTVLGEERRARMREDGPPARTPGLGDAFGKTSKRR